MIYKMCPEYKVDFNTIENLIAEHNKEKERIELLERYYKRGSDVLKEKESKDGKPNNKTISNYSRYIVTILVGFFVGKPINITSEDIELLEHIVAFNKYNDEPSHNTSLAKKCAINGYAYELLYNSRNKNEKQVRMTVLDSKEVIYVVDNTVEELPLFAVRYFEHRLLDDYDYVIEVYDTVNVTRYQYYSRGHKKAKEGALVQSGQPIPHGFKDVPVNVYLNNEEMSGDFEPVIPLITSYDYMNSWSMDDFESLTDCMLVLYGMLNMQVDKDGNPKPPDFKKTKFVHIQDLNGKLEYLSKNINDTAVENFKNRLQADIHKFSFAPDLTDQNFVGSASGEALKWKIQGMSSIRATKEQFFKKGLARRNELLCNRWGINSDMDRMNSINYTFTENTPKNFTEMVNNARNTDGLLSERTRIEELGYDADVEFARREEEEANSSLAYSVDFTKMRDEEETINEDTDKDIEELDAE